MYTTFELEGSLGKTYYKFCSACQRRWEVTSLLTEHLGGKPGSTNRDFCPARTVKTLILHPEAGATPHEASTVCKTLH